MDRPENSIPPATGTGQLPAEGDVDVRIADAVTEYEALKRSGATPDIELYLARYPELAPGLRECIEALHFVDHAFSGRTIRRNPLPLGQLTRLGDFQILRKVGGGGMGDVYEAHQLSLARRVALKVLSTSLSSNEHSLKRFQQEAQAAATLQHPHIVPVYSVGRVEKNYFYAMQFIDGASLAELLVRFRSQEHLLSDTVSPTASESSQEAQSALVDDSVATVVNDQSSQETHREGIANQGEARTHPLLSLKPKSSEYFCAVARIIQQAADALQHAHENGIIHRDIKPSNLLVDLKGNVWVADFGLARLPDSNLTATSDVLGTLRYMSPEQASGRTVALDGRTDVYSLGATMYEMLTLQPLFESDDRRSLLRKVVEVEPVAPKQSTKDLPRDLELITLKTLSKEIDQRYTTAAALSEDLERFLTHRPILAKPPTTKQILLKFGRRNRALIIGIVTLIVITLIVAVIAATLALNRISRANRDALDANIQLTSALEEKNVALYRANMILARRDWDNGSHDGARARLDATSERHRKWEWHYLNSLCTSPSKRIENAHFLDLPCAISPDGSRVLCFRPLQNETFLTIRSVPHWNGTAEAFQRFKPKDRGFQFHNGRGYTFCKSGAFAAAIDSDKLVSVMDTKTGNLLHLLPAPFPIHGAIYLEDDGNVLAPLLVGDHVETWDLGGNTKLTEIPDKSRTRCWSPDGERIYQDSGITRQSHTGKEISKVNNQVRDALTGGVCSFGPDSRFMAGGAKYGIRVIDTDSGFERFYFAQGNVGYLMAFSPDGTRFATAGNDRSLWLYDLLSGKVLFHTYVDTPGSLVLAFQDDGTTLVSASNLQERLWNCLDMVEGDICAVTNPINVLGETEVICEGKVGQSRVLRRIDFRTNEILEDYALDKQDFNFLDVCNQTSVAALYSNSKLALWNLKEKKQLAEIPIKSTYNLQFSRDGNWLIVNGGYLDATVTLIDVKKGTVSRTLEHAGLIARSFQFSNDSKRFFVGYQSGDVVAWDTASGEKCWTVSKHTQAVGAIAVDLTDQYVAAAGTDEVVNVLDVESGDVVTTLRGHSSHVTALAFHPSQPRLATAGADSMIRIWDTETWEPIFQIPTPDTSSKLSFSPSGDRLVAFQTSAVVCFDISQERNRDQQRKDWLARSIVRSEQYKNRFATEWFLKELVEMDPTNAQLAKKLEEVRRLGKKPEADSVSLPLTALTIESLRISNMESVYATVASKAVLGDKQYVKRAADHIVSQINDKTSGFTASLVYRLYMLCTGEPAELEALIPEFEAKTKGYKNPFAAHMVRGGLLYRAGRYDAALASLKQGETIKLETKNHVVNWLLLSMTHSQLGNLTEAEDWLGRVRKWRQDTSSFDFPKVDYQVRLLYSVLVLEAEKLLAEKRNQRSSGPEKPPE